MYMSVRSAPMKRRRSGEPRRLLALALAHGLLSPALVSAASPAAPFLACADEKDAATRLACFDAAAAHARSLPAAAVAPAAAAPAAAPTPTLTKEEKFGLRGELKQQKAPELAELEALTAKVTKVSTKPHGELIVTLDNGQVWYEIQAYSGLRVKVGDVVTIKSGALGSYSLVANGRSGKVSRAR